MDKEKFVALMPYISEDLVSEIVKRQNVSEEGAMKKVYSSDLYSILENEETKVWQYSTKMLYSLLEQEESQGSIQFPDV